LSSVNLISRCLACSSSPCKDCKRPVKSETSSIFLQPKYRTGHGR
jgi:hypothetical protein